MATARPVQDELNLTPEEMVVFDQLLSDYREAAAIHVPGYRGGGLARKIAAALVHGGWRKQAG
jgi:hypothetical protein